MPQNSSKSIVPDPSSSISSMIPSRSSEVNRGSNSAIISLNCPVVMKPCPSLSYTRKASFNYAFIVSSSGSSTKNLAHNWQNSPNSISPDPSSSISSRISFNSSLDGLKPIALKISSKSSAPRNSCFFTSKRLKHNLSTLISSTSSAVASLISSKSISAKSPIFICLQIC